MEIYTLKGKITELWDMKVISDKFRKREFVVEVNSSGSNSSYIDHVKMQAVQNNCEQLDGVNIGDTIAVRWRIAGRRWGTKPDYSYFTNIEATEISVILRGDGSSADDAIEEELPLEADDNTLFEVQEKEEIPNEGEDDLPF